MVGINQKGRNYCWSRRRCQVYVAHGCRLDDCVLFDLTYGAGWMICHFSII